MRFLLLLVTLMCACEGREIPAPFGVDAGMALDSGTVDAGGVDTGASDASAPTIRVCSTMCGTAQAAEPKMPCVLFPSPCETQPIDAPAWCLDQATTRDLPGGTPLCRF